MVNTDKFKNATSYYIANLWTGEIGANTSRTFSVTGIDAYDNVTIRVTPLI